MKRRLTLALAAGALVVAMVPGAALASHGEGAPVGACPPGAAWSLVDPMHQPQAADHNRDGWLCRAGFFVGPGFLAVDNSIPLR